MSGLETVAGAFAVVGFADVLVRTGRDLYWFLCDIKDAPDDVQRLRIRIDETILLVDAARSYLQQLVTCTTPTHSVAVVASFQGALRGLDREFNSLRAVTTRFQGNIKSWMRVKYVLDERKIGRALRNVDRSASLLTTALTFASG